MDRIQELRAGVARRRRSARRMRRSRRSSRRSTRKVDEVRKRIVATKEGGAITGEERLREHTDLLYGAIMSYEGAPTTYQVERIDVLEAELADIEQQFGALLKQDLPVLNTALAAGGLRAIDAPAEVAVTADSFTGSGSGQRDGNDEDEGTLAESLPRNRCLA